MWALRTRFAAQNQRSSLRFAGSFARLVLYHFPDDGSLTDKGLKKIRTGRNFFDCRASTVEALHRHPCLRTLNERLVSRSQNEGTIQESD